ncbi:MAG: M23 family metallopeptidase, partial [Bacteroidota bacterium]
PVSADTTEVPVVLTRDAMTFSLDRLLIPVEGVDRGDLRDSFTAPRSGGRVHRAIDIGAPVGTPVLAVSDGEVVRRTRSRLGGITLYLRSPDGDYDFYYAHLSRYADGATVGTLVQQGDTLGYVGTTGNARSPHLHFQVLRRTGTRGRGTPVNPYPLLRQSELHAESGDTVRG